MNIEKIEFQVNWKCNMNCIFCFQDGSQYHREIKLEHVVKALDELRNTLKIVWITGGEPLLSRQLLFSIIKESKQRGLYTGLSSNGLILEDSLSALKESGLDEIRVSLDSTDRHIYERIRGTPGSYDKVVKSIEAAVEAGFVVSIRCTIVHTNLETVPEVVGLAKSLGISRIELKSVLPIGRGSADTMVQDSVLEEVFNQSVQKEDRRTDVMVMCNHLPKCRGFSVKNNFACQCAHEYVYVYCDGSIAPCSYFPKNGFNLDDCTIETAWRSDLFHSIRYSQPPECGECDDFNACKNGCPAVLYANGKLNQYCYDVIGGLQ